MKPQTIIVVQTGCSSPSSRQDPPFVMYSKDYETKTGNDRFEGYLIDLIQKISEELKFDYNLYESPDGNYGSSNADGTWNGMINELIIGVRYRTSNCKKKKKKKMSAGVLSAEGPELQSGFLCRL